MVTMTKGKVFLLPLVSLIFMAIVGAYWTLHNEFWEILDSTLYQQFADEGGYALRLFLEGQREEAWRFWSRGSMLVKPPTYHLLPNLIAATGLPAQDLWRFFYSFLWLLLLVSQTKRLARLVGASPNSAWLAALALAYCPDVLGSALYYTVDLGLLATAAWFYAEIATSPPRRSMVRICIAAALGIAIKPMFPVYAVPALLLLQATRGSEQAPLPAKRRTFSSMILIVIASAGISYAILFAIGPEILSYVLQRSIGMDLWGQRYPNFAAPFAPTFYLFSIAQALGWSGTVIVLFAVPFAWEHISARRMLISFSAQLLLLTLLAWKRGYYLLPCLPLLAAALATAVPRSEETIKRACWRERWKRLFSPTVGFLLHAAATCWMAFIPGPLGDVLGLRLEEDLEHRGPSAVPPAQAITTWLTPPLDQNAVQSKTLSVYVLGLHHRLPFPHSAAETVIRHFPETYAKRFVAYYDHITAPRAFVDIYADMQRGRDFICITPVTPLNDEDLRNIAPPEFSLSNYVKASARFVLEFKGPEKPLLLHVLYFKRLPKNPLARTRQRGMLRGR